MNRFIDLDFQIRGPKEVIYIKRNTKIAKKLCIKLLINTNIFGPEGIIINMRKQIEKIEQDNNFKF